MVPNPNEKRRAPGAEYLFRTVLRRRDDVPRVLDALGLACVLTDRQHRVVFISSVAERTLGGVAFEREPMPVERLFAFAGAGCDELKQILSQPNPRRRSTLLTGKNRRDRAVALEAEVVDNPVLAGGRIIMLWDVDGRSPPRRRPTSLDAQRLLGESPAMRGVLERIQSVALVDSTVLIAGETGTGKEVAARVIHSLSHRQGHPYVAVNCAGLTDSLLASQLFGHRRGAFTGATSDHRGFFEIANGGTILLDEMGDISPTVQASLLRVLAEREFVRLGDSTPRPVDVRVIAATHRNLVAEVEAGQFRADLLYRIQVARIAMPPLREISEDIPTLVNSFLEEYRRLFGSTVTNLDDDAWRQLICYPWPGNVRELKSAIEYAVLGTKDRLLRASDLPPEIAHYRVPKRRNAGAGGERGSARLEKVLEMTSGNRSAAARLLGISRATVYRRLREQSDKAPRD